MKISVAIGLALATCAFAPNGIERLDPPAHYRTVYDSATACAGRWVRGTPRPFSEIRWSMVPGHDFKCGHGRCIGHTQFPNDIAIAQDFLTTDWVVKHEIIHYITQLEHWPGDTALWGSACHATWGYLPQDPNYRP